MLVPAMTLEEMRDEIMKEIPILKNKVGYMCNNARRMMRRYKMTTYEKITEYRSRQKNSWLIRLHWKENEKDFYIGTIVYFYSNRGLVAFTFDIVKGILHYHTSHFFTRYNERLNLGLVKPIDILFHYLRGTVNISYGHLGEVKPGLSKIFGVSQEGIVLGYHHHALKMLRFNTFVTHDMLKGQQLGQEEYLKQILIKHNPDFTNAE